MGNDQSSDSTSGETESRSNTRQGQRRVRMQVPADQSPRNRSVTADGAVPSRPPCLPNRRDSKELIIDNGFNTKAKALPHFFGADGPSMNKAMTFDERKLLSSKSRQGQLNSLCGGNPMKRSVTFVSKSKLEVKDDTSLQDILYRKHFMKSDPHARAMVPVYDHAISFAPQEEHEFNQDNQDKIVIVVDTFSTGAVLAYQLYLQGYRVVCVLSGDLKGLMGMIPDDLSFSFTATLSLKNLGDSDLSFEQLCSEISSLGWPVVAVMAGAETGVELADKLSSHLGLRTNGTSKSEARRNKYIMGETIRAAGIRAVKQLRASTWGEIMEFLDEWRPSPFQVVLKPISSAGSDDVILCQSVQGVQEAFGRIIGKINALGLVNSAVLVQEYLDGPEFVVDMVSRDGEHKVVAIWEYDWRPANNSTFVCHGCRLLSLEDQANCPADLNHLIAYQKRVCSALGILNGPSHGEIIWSVAEHRPILVEVGARCHGSEGLWISISNDVFGHNQVNATIDAYLSPERFNALPDKPLKRRKSGCMRFIMSFHNGTLESVDADLGAEIARLPSYQGHQLFTKPGSTIKETIDCFTWAGCVQLCHERAEVMQADVERIQAIQEEGLLHISECLKPQQQCVAVVDPFSTGANLAAYLYRMKYHVVAVYSANMEQLATMKNLIPQGIDLTFESIVPFEGGVEGVAAKLLGTGYEVVAVMAGAETGVELADKLSSHLGLRTNGTSKSEARRNKYIMGETIRAAGVRAVKQLKASSWEEVTVFLDEWRPDPFQVVLKPIESAGSEDVTLCRSIDETHAAFNRIFKKVNSLGLVNTSVLVQEYLEGQEYVVDMVSKDGHHKVLAIWECDKRAINGAHFVLHGYNPLISTAFHCAELIAYQKRVLTALGIVNGPSHGELKWQHGEPVLVEVGARCHGGEGTWVDVANGVYGYNQVEATGACYTSCTPFDVFPDEPAARVGHGRLLCLVCKVSGILMEINPDLIEEIRHMRSFIRMEIFLKPGELVRKTIDCFTLAGVIMLTHRSEVQVVNDYDRIRQMEDDDLFVCD